MNTVLPNAKLMEDAVAQAKEVVETVVKASSDMAKKNYDQLVATSTANAEKVKAEVEKAQVATLKGFEQAAELNKANLAAVIEAGNIWTKGYEEIQAAVIASTQSALDAAIAQAKAFASVKSLDEALELQKGYAKETVDTFVAESTKLGEMSGKVANDAAAPITKQVEATVEKILKPVAA